MSTQIPPWRDRAAERQDIIPDLGALLADLERMAETLGGERAGAAAGAAKPSAGRETTAALADLAAALRSLAVADGRLRAPVAAPPSTETAVDWERRYRSLFDAVPDACFVTDTAGVIREANPAASGLVGFARAYCIGKPLVAYIEHADAGRFADALRRATDLGDGKSLAWAGRLKPLRRRRDLRVEAHVSALRDAGGAVAGLAWFGRDVTAERDLEARHAALFAEQEERLRQRTAELDAIIKVQATLLNQLGPAGAD